MTKPGEFKFPRSSQVLLLRPEPSHKTGLPAHPPMVSVNKKIAYFTLPLTENDPNQI